MVRLFADTARRDGRPNRADPEHCKAAMFEHYDYHQCSNKPSRDGWCGVHHPDTIAKREARQKAKDAVQAALIAEGHRRWQLGQDYGNAVRDAIKAIAAGHNDPRALCQKILTDYAEVIS